MEPKITTNVISQLLIFLQIDKINRKNYYLDIHCYSANTGTSVYSILQRVFVEGIEYDEPFPLSIFKERRLQIPRRHVEGVQGSDMPTKLGL